MNYIPYYHDENDNEDDINKASNINNETDDSSLKEIYTGQT